MWRCVVTGNLFSGHPGETTSKIFFKEGSQHRNLLSYRGAIELEGDMEGLRKRASQPHVYQFSCHGVKLETSTCIQHGTNCTKNLLSCYRDQTRES